MWMQENEAGLGMKAVKMILETVALKWQPDLQVEIIY